MPQWMLGAFVLMFGLCLGSFFNVVILRLPAGRSIGFPASHCPHCGTPLRFYDNIPVVSYLNLRGRCRFCASRISLRYPLVEILTGVLFYALFRIYGLTPQFFVELLLVSLLLVIAFIDLDTFLIPDSLSLSGIVLGFVASWFTPRLSWTESLLGIVVGGGVLFAIAVLYQYLRKQDGMGGGDIKLLAMIGAFLGSAGVVFTVLASSLIGTLYGMGVMIRSRKQLTTTMIPFGPFLSLGAILYVFYGQRIFDWYFGLWLVP